MFSKGLRGDALRLSESEIWIDCANVSTTVCQCQAHHCSPISTFSGTITVNSRQAPFSQLELKNLADELLNSRKHHTVKSESHGVCLLL